MREGDVLMEALVWETAEELDMKLAQRVRNIRRRRKEKDVRAYLK